MCSLCVILPMDVLAIPTGGDELMVDAYQIASAMVNACFYAVKYIVYSVCVHIKSPY